jgi:hypothetical protein
MKQKCFNLLCYSIFWVLTALLSAEAYAMCGEKLEKNSEFLAMIPRLDPTSIFVALKKGELELAVSKIKGILEKILGSSFPLPKIQSVNTLQSNPALFDKKTWTIFYFPKALKQAIDEGLISYEEWPAAATIIIAHELVHAWQAYKTNLLKTAHEKSREAIFEGHATFVQSILARMFGISDISDKGIRALTNKLNYINIGYNTMKAEQVAEGNALTRVYGCKLFLNTVLNKESKFTVDDLINKMPATGLPEQYVKNPQKYENEIKLLLNEH